MNSGSDPAQIPFDSPAAPDEAAPADEATGASPSLDDLVRETMGAQGEEVDVSPEVWSAFLQVARRHPAPAAVDPPIVHELVNAVLDIRLKGLRNDSDALALCARRIAETLWEDGLSRERLDRLWNRLHGETP